MESNLVNLVKETIDNEEVTASAITDLELKKQDKLTAGNNITISSDNTIDCNVSSELSDSYVEKEYKQLIDEESISTFSIRTSNNMMFTALSKGDSYENSFSTLEDNLILLINEAVETKKKIDILYKFEVTFSGGGNFKKGTTANGTLKWTVKVNGVDVNPNKQELNGNIIEDVTLRSSGYSVTENTTFTLKVDDITKTQNVAFYNPAFFGVVSNNYTFNSDGIVDAKSLNLTELTNYGKKAYTSQTIVDNSGETKKVLYMYPSRLGNLSSMIDQNTYPVIFTKVTSLQIKGIENEEYVGYLLTDAASLNNMKYIFS